MVLSGIVFLVCLHLSLILAYYMFLKIHKTLLYKRLALIKVYLNSSWQRLSKEGINDIPHVMCTAAAILSHMPPLRCALIQSWVVFLLLSLGYSAFSVYREDFNFLLVTPEG